MVAETFFLTSRPFFVARLVDCVQMQLMCLPVAVFLFFVLFPTAATVTTKLSGD